MRKIAIAWAGSTPDSMQPLITRVDIVARGVIQGCLDAGKDPADVIAIFRIPGSWEEEGFKILEKYGVEYCDRSVSMYEAAGRAVAKIGA